MQIVTPSRVSLRSVSRVATIAAILVASFLYPPSAQAATSRHRHLVLSGALPASKSQVNLGPNVYLFTPSMPLSEIQATVNSIATQQISNQFGTQRYALLFEPGTYGSSTSPLNFQVGYYTTVAGLGQSPADVVINGSIDVYNQCFDGSCIASDNFWRSLSNLTINVTNSSFGCYAGEFWAVSQAAPIRRVLVNGNATLMDYCTSPSFASGGFIADSEFEGGSIVSGSQQHMDHSEQPDRWLEQRRLEPSLLRRHRRARPVLSGSSLVRRPLHHPRDQPGHA